MISSEKRQALGQILTNYANDDAVTTHEAVTGVIGLLGLNGEKTLRDEFAMAAMQAMLTRGSTAYQPDRNQIAKDAYFYADGMLEARK